MKLKTPKHMWRRMISTSIDLSLIYCTTSLLLIIAWQFVPLNFGIVSIGVFLLYCLLSYVLLERADPGEDLLWVAVG